MRLPIVLALLGTALSSAEACPAPAAGCLPPVVVFPAYTHEGQRLGMVESLIRPPLALERSRFTDQPLTVVYNDPGRLPGSVAPAFELVPLPRAKPFRTRAVYAHGG